MIKTIFEVINFMIMFAITITLGRMIWHGFEVNLKIGISNYSFHGNSLKKLFKK